MSTQYQNDVFIYNKDHVVPIFYGKNGGIEDRNLTIIIVKRENLLIIKIRDTLEYWFNYAIRIDSAFFEVMKAEQKLDINFAELKSNMLDMLRQVQSRELFLKCEVEDETCNLVFYGRSRIKFVILLTLPLRLSNYKEIIAEMVNNMHEIREQNNLLTGQINMYKHSLSNKDQQIQQMERLQSQLKQIYLNALKQLEDTFKEKSQKTEMLILNKIDILNRKILELFNNVNKTENILVSNTNRQMNLVQSLRCLKFENSEKARKINELEMRCEYLKSEKMSVEQNLIESRRAINDKDSHINTLTKSNEELRSDLEKATKIITQKHLAIEELSQDLLQANQMLVNFNKHYDDKVKKLEEIETSLALKDKIIEEQKVKLKELNLDFQRYKEINNDVIQEKLWQDLLVAKDKIEELEAAIRKANKINTLLTEKISSQRGFQV